jgi:hypoxanthine phosphoribosyltransferase
LDILKPLAVSVFSIMSKIDARPGVSKMMRVSQKSHAKEGGLNQKWYDILKLIPPQARVIALIALVSDGVIIAVIELLPEAQRIYGFVVFACVLIGTLIGTVLVIRQSASQNHSQPNLVAKVRKLTNQLVEGRFLPDLIVAIPRGGLVVAGILAKHLGDEKIVPVISLTRLDIPTGFDNPFNHFNFKIQDFDTSNPVNMLIVDDICRSGRTLVEATIFLGGAIRSQALGPSRDFVIKTAAISYYRTHSRATAPDFFVDRPAESIRDASGEEEEM